MYVAPHKNDDIGCGYGGKQFGMLCFFHIRSVNFFHEPYGVRIDTVFWLGSCGVTFKNVRRKHFSETFRNLAAAGIMHAYERCFGFDAVMRKASNVFLRIHSRSAAFAYEVFDLFYGKHSARGDDGSVDHECGSHHDAVF